jgi:4-hydroxy-2-oxoheptanedioate aldolase
MHRIPGHDHSAIGFALDAGASIIVPQVETVEQAQHLVSSAKFGVAHKGTRSAPPCRWLMGLSDTNSPIDPTRSVFENVNDQAAIIIQMESELAINNLDVILTAVGDQIDAVWIGGLDLRVSMGLDGFWGSEPEFLKVIKQYEETLKKHDMPNSGGGFGRNWSLCANKAFAVVSGDVVTLMGETATITDARQVFGPLKKGQETNVRDVLNGTPL